MKKNLMSLALLTTLSIASFAASAEDDAYKGAWYALPGVSYNWTDGALKADDGMGGFIRVGKEFAPNWDLQFGGSYASVDGNAGGKYKQTLVGVDALYMFSREKLRPFLLVGVGYADNKLDYAVGGGSKGSIMGNIGAGVQYSLTDSIGLQADLRSVWSEANVGGDSKTVGNTILNLGAISVLVLLLPLLLFQSQLLSQLRLSLWLKRQRQLLLLNQHVSPCLKRLRFNQRLCLTLINTQSRVKTIKCLMKRLQKLKSMTILSLS